MKNTSLRLSSILIAAFLIQTAKTDAPSLDSPSTTTINIKGTIDGLQNIIIHDGNLSIEHTQWDKIKTLTINGRKWSPNWTENRSSLFSDFDPPLGPFEEPVTVRIIRGRGTIEVTQPPSPSNDFKLIISLKDEASGADDYYIRISW